MGRHREVWAVELNIKPGIEDRFIFGPHGGDKRVQIGLMARIMPVYLKGRDQSGGRGVHEGPCPLSLGFKSCLVPADVVKSRLKVDKPDLADARCPGEFLASHDRAELPAQLRVRRKVLRRLAFDMAAEPAQPFLHVS